jgi:ADP-ribosylglycohydrolase
VLDQTTTTTLDLTGARFLDKIRGCWVGKNCGGTLGTPIEEAWGREEPFDIWWYPELRDGGLPNDDLEMQLVWLTALEQVGSGLKARDLARYWLDHIGYNFDEYGLSKTNLRLGLQPPVSGHFNNWFLDCMGSPIRTEVWACAAPGVPRLAARFAYEDAICDHAGGESVYGSLFNAAIQSAAFVVEDKEKLIDIGLSYVHPESRTAAAVHAALEAHRDGVTWQEARKRVLTAVPHHVAQYSPINMGFQVIGLLWGKDFGDALCITVNCGYDTDSSGGTIGSWWGIVDGDSRLPEKWTEPFGESISTNEDWGGVRHMSDGSTPIPQTLPEVIERMANAAQKLLAEHQLVDGDGLVHVDEASLYADDSIRELWSRDPLTVSFDFPQLRTELRYSGSPAVDPGSNAEFTTVLGNPHPDAVEVEARLVVPSGWADVAPQRLTIPAAGQAALSWEVPVPNAALVENSNRLFLISSLRGYPQDPAVPITLIGSSALRVSEVYPADGRSSGELLEESFPPEADHAGDVLAREGVWRDFTAKDNRIPLETLGLDEGVVYVQTFLDAPEAMSVYLGVDSGAPFAGWLNGTKFAEGDRVRPVRPSYAGGRDGYASVRLEPGMNELLVKLVRTGEAKDSECFLLLSTDDVLHHGITTVGRTRFPG